MSEESDKLLKLCAEREGLRHALEVTLEFLAARYGDQARHRLEIIRDTLIRQQRQSIVPPGLDHATITGPAIAAIRAAFDSVLADIPTPDPAPTKPAPTKRAPKLRLVT